MDTHYREHLMARMLAEQARMLKTDGMVDEARELLAKAFVMLSALGARQKPALVPIRIRRR